MRKILILLLLIMPTILTAQKEVSLKKKFFGRYAGTIPAYKLDSGFDIIEVSSSAIYIVLSDGAISVIIGNNKLNGSYEVMFEAKTYYLLDAKMDGQLATERILVYKRGKRLSRDGMYPQPVSELKMVRG